MGGNQDGDSFELIDDNVPKKDDYYGDSQPKKRRKRPKKNANYDGPLSSLGARFMAHMADMVLLMLTILPGASFAIFLLIEADSRGRKPQPEPLILCLLVTLFLMFALAAYNAFILSRDGQSIGKKMVGIRIVNYHDGGNPGFVQAVLLRSYANAMLGQFVPFYGLVDACFIFTDERRCVHDLIANTTVIDC
jgi:uncharacterized RDD family membrane protein YckC